MRKLLAVIKQPCGLIEFHVDGLCVKTLRRGITFEQARQQAYEFVWARPTYMWTIKGAVSA